MFKQSLADQAIHNAEVALSTGQSAASQAIDNIGKVVDQGMNQVRETTHQLRENAARASAGTVDHIRQDPVKSVLIAAAAGAALMALVSLLTRSNSQH